MSYDKPVDINRNTHYGNNFYEFMSRKLNRVVKAFSNLEFWNLITLEMNHNILKYCEQPLKANVDFDGYTFETIFDVWVKYKDEREEFQEVKYAEELENNNSTSDRCYQQIAIQKAWCEQNNQKHVIRTDKDIIKGIYFIRNLLYLYPKVLRWREVNSTSQKYILSVLDDRSTLTVGQLIAGGIISKENGIGLLADMYYQGLISFNDIVDEPFSFSTEVYLNVN